MRQGARERRERGAGAYGTKDWGREAPQDSRSFTPTTWTCGWGPRCVRALAGFPCESF